MYCLTNICYVCLRKKDNLISSVNSSVSVNKELRRIIGYHAFNQPWLKTKRVILTCEECYSLLRKTYQFLNMWHKNTALLQGYIDLLNTTTIPNTGNEAELHVHVDIKQTDINNVKREVILEDEQIYTFQWEHNIEETEDLFVNLADSFVKEENTWKRTEVDVTEECSTDNNSTEIIEEVNDIFVNLEDYSVSADNKQTRVDVKDLDEHPIGNNSMYNESASKISINDNSHHTNTDSVSAGFTGKQIHPTNKDYLNTVTEKSYECSTCNKCFITKTKLNMHTRIHTDKKWYECAICKKRCNQKGKLKIHMRVHTGEKSYECTTCKKCFTTSSVLVKHIRIHTGEKPYQCATCKRCFTRSHHLIDHMRIHTGEKPYQCVICKRCFARRSYLVSHMRKHTGEKPHQCSICNESFRYKLSMKNHMRNKHADKGTH